jgi:hypothetical protein
MVSADSAPQLSLTTTIALPWTAASFVGSRPSGADFDGCATFCVSTFSMLWVCPAPLDRNDR